MQIVFLSCCASLFFEMNLSDEDTRPQILQNSAGNSETRNSNVMYDRINFSSLCRNRRLDQTSDARRAAALSQLLRRPSYVSGHRYWTPYQRHPPSSWNRRPNRELTNRRLLSRRRRLFSGNPYYACAPRCCARSTTWNKGKIRKRRPLQNLGNKEQRTRPQQKTWETRQWSVYQLETKKSNVDTPKNKRKQTGSETLEYLRGIR